MSENSLTNILGLFEKESQKGNTYWEGTPATRNTDSEYVEAAKEVFKKLAEDPTKYVFALFESSEEVVKKGGPKFSLSVREKQYSKSGKGGNLSKFRK